jgi:hypothetical protein
MRKVVKVESVSDKERKEYLSKEGCAEMASDLMDGKPFVSKTWKTSYPRKRAVVLAELTTSDRLLKLSRKDGNRAKVCRSLIVDGRISRDDYKKLNPWGDIRFIKEYVEEEFVEDKTYYVLKKHIAEEVKGKC